MMPILASCVGNKALLGAGDLGRIGAGVDLPAQPSECARPVPHIALATGQEARANARQRACYQFNEDIRTGYSR
jgi:hypothetical protein